MSVRVRTEYVAGENGRFESKTVFHSPRLGRYRFIRNNPTNDLLGSPRLDPTKSAFVNDRMQHGAKRRNCRMTFIKIWNSTSLRLATLVRNSFHHFGLITKFRNLSIVSHHTLLSFANRPLYKVLPDICA